MALKIAYAAFVSAFLLSKKLFKEYYICLIVKICLG